MRDKAGNKLSTKEFMHRWGEGIKKITPLQQAKISLMGTWFVIIGVIIGIVVTFISRTWWLVLILFGSFFVTGVSLLGAWQKYSALKKIDEIMKGHGEQLNDEGGLNEEQESTDGI